MCGTHAGRDGVRLDDLTIAILQHVRAHTVQHTWRSLAQRCTVTIRVYAVAACLDADQAHALVLDEGVEEADGVGAAADARNDGIGKLALLLLKLLLDLLADDALEVANHGGEGVRADGTADQAGRGNKSASAWG